MTIEQELIKAQSEASTAKQDLAEAKERNEQLAADLATARQTISTLGAERDKYMTKADDIAKALAKSETDNKAALDAKEAEVEKRAHARANEIARAQGVAPVREESATGPRNDEDVAAQLAAIKDPVKRAEFYRQNKERIAAAFRAQSK